MAAVARGAWARAALPDGRRLAAAILLSAAFVCAITGIVHLLRPLAPVFSLGVLYVIAVLPAAVFWGRTYAIVVSIGSMLLFNFLFLPPTLTFTLSGEENWVVLTVYLITGILVSDLALRARTRAVEAEQREREASLLAEVSTALLSGAPVATELPRIADAAARVLRLPAARIELGPQSPHPGDEAVVSLRAGDREVGTLHCPPGSEPGPSARSRFLPALASLLAIASDRERLAQEALETEALRRSDSLKTALLRTVSHDLRSPLTAIRAALEALESTTLTLDADARRDLLRSAHTESQRLDRVVRNLLDLSRLQAGAARPQLRIRTVEGLVDQALVHLPASSVTVEVALAPGLPLVDVDPVQIEHALVNLLENAVKFSSPGSSVELHAGRSGDEVIVRIRDHGPGLPAGELDRIFEPFRHASSAGGRQGAGLGLAIARGFAEASGGRVWAESPPGGGAAFALALPASGHADR